jgi:hypothetical protein
MQTINDYLDDLKAYCEDMDSCETIDAETHSGVLCVLRTAARHCEEVYYKHEALRLARERTERQRVALVKKNAAHFFPAPN